MVDLLASASVPKARKLLARGVDIADHLDMLLGYNDKLFERVVLN